MNAQWQAWFECKGGVFDAGGVHFDTPENEIARLNGPAVASPLAAFRLVKVSGDDALTFLQGQFSSDVREVSAAKAQYSSYSTAKGRMLASMLIWNYQSDYYLMVSADIAEAFVRRLSMFILRSKVKASLVDDTWSLLGLAGEANSEWLNTHFESLPEVAGDVVAGQGRVLIRLRSGALLLAESGGLAILEALPLQHWVGSAVWSLFDIRAGVAWIRAATQDMFVPQMANMDRIGAISFRKGCYPGQEIVARTEYLGKVKRRLYRVEIAANVDDGDALYIPSMGEQVIGNVVNAVRIAGDKSECLVVVQEAGWSESIHLRSINGPQLTALNLSYSDSDE